MKHYFTYILTLSILVKASDEVKQVNQSLDTLNSLAKADVISVMPIPEKEKNNIRLGRVPTLERINQSPEIKAAFAPIWKEFNENITKDLADDDRISSKSGAQMSMKEIWEEFNTNISTALKDSCDTNLKKIPSYEKIATTFNVEKEKASGKNPFDALFDEMSPKDFETCITSLDELIKLEEAKEKKN